MPPPDSDAPLSDADRKTLLDWIDAQIDRSLGGESNPALRRTVNCHAMSLAIGLPARSSITCDLPWASSRPDTNRASMI